MNHIVQPHFTLAYVKTNRLSELYPQIDGDTPTTNPPSLSIGRYTEIDSLSTGLVFRYGLRNMLMTSRDANSHRWFSWDVFMDAYLHDPVNRRDFSNLFSFMRWNPVPWMEYRSEMQAPVLGKDKISGCREYNNSLRFMPWRSTELVVGHRYLNQHSLLEDSSQLDLRILQRFSEAWAFSGKWRFSLLDGKLDIQEYNVYHNMGSWYLGVGAFVRKNGNKNEFRAGHQLYHPADRGLYAGQIPLISGKDTVFCGVFPGSFFLFQRIRVLRMGSARCGVLFRRGKDM